MTDAEQAAALVEDFAKRIPEATPLIQRHLEDNFNEMLPHVLMADLTRWIIGLQRAAARGDAAAARLRDRALAFLEERFADLSDLGGRDVIAASFLENLHQAGDDLPALTAHFGPTLRAALPARP